VYRGIVYRGIVYRDMVICGDTVYDVEFPRTPRTEDHNPETRRMPPQY
jgi:hypothetical protein